MLGHPSMIFLVLAQKKNSLQPYVLEEKLLIMAMDLEGKKILLVRRLDASETFIFSDFSGV